MREPKHRHGFCKTSTPGLMKCECGAFARLHRRLCLVRHREASLLEFPHAYRAFGNKCKLSRSHTGLLFPIGPEQARHMMEARKVG